MEEEDPTRGDKGGCDHSAPAIGEAPPQQGDERQARHGERCRDEAHPAEPEPEMCDPPGEEEVERSPAPLTGDVLDDARDAVPPDEEREGLILKAKDCRYNSFCQIIDNGEDTQAICYIIQAFFFIQLN